MLIPFALLLALGGPPADDEILRKLEAWQATQLHGSIRPTYVVHDRWPGDHKPRTIFAVVATTSEGGRQLVAFHVNADGSLGRLSSYDDDAAWRVEQRDVTGDGVAEVLLTLLPGNRSAAVEILRGDGREFQWIGDTSDYAEFIDLNGDGIPEIVERAPGPPNSCGETPTQFYVQQFRGGVFEEMRSPRLAYFFSYKKRTDEPEQFVEDWPLQDSFPLRSRVRIFNGQRDAHRATGISIRLGDSGDIPLTLTADRRYSEASVRLPSRCVRARITVRGHAGAVVTGLLEATGDR